jgi:hypothetical protein
VSAIARADHHLNGEARFKCHLGKTIRFDDGSPWVHFHRVMLLAGQPRDGDTVFWDGDWAGEYVAHTGIGTDEIDVTLRSETYPNRDADGFQELARSWPGLGWESSGL